MQQYTVSNLVIVLLFTVISSSSAEEKVDYTGHTVIRAAVKDSKQLKALKDFHQQTDGVDLWRSPGPHREADLRVHPDALDLTTDFLHSYNIPHDTVTRDVQGLIDAERQGFIDRTDAGFNTSTYHTYEEILAWLDELSETCGKICSVFDIGTTEEGRKLRVIRIGVRTNSNTPAVWIDGGIHAREWIAPATAVHLIHKFVDGYKQRDPNIRYLLKSYVWYILPLANPDGYSYTWTSDRLWRKNRSVHPDSDCKGTDPNRNWNYYWGGRGTSGNPCRENYHGRYPFSEAEPRSMATFIWALRSQLLVYISLHSYGQYWLTPWGFTYNVPDDYTDMINQAREATSAMSQSNMTDYTVGSSSRLLYLASGGSDDWAKGVARVKYSYTVELGDTGEHGFILPDRYIQPTGENMYSAIKSVAMGALRERKRKMRKRGPRSFM